MKHPYVSLLFVKFDVPIGGAAAYLHTIGVSAAEEP